MFTAKFGQIEWMIAPSATHDEKIKEKICICEKIDKFVGMLIPLKLVS